MYLWDVITDDVVIYSKFIDPRQLDNLENEAAIVLCQMKMYFPPSFFDIMVHLIVHLVARPQGDGSHILRILHSL